MASTPPNVRAQLVPLLQKILQHDFPEQWPGFLEITLQLLGTNDANSVYAGLQCLLAICRVYRFKAGFGGEIADFLGCLDLPVKPVRAAAWYRFEPVYYRLYQKLKHEVFY